MNFVIATSAFQSQVADLLPCNNGRKAQLIFSLIKSYKLLDHFDHVITSPRCQKSQLVRFHSTEYLEVLFANDSAENESDVDIGLELPMFAKSFYETNSIDEQEREAWFTTQRRIFEYYRGEYGENFCSRGCARASLSKFGLLHDCPKFPYLGMYLDVITGATISLIAHLNKQKPTIAINWDGGRHHAFKELATGFCYINDIVLLIQNLRRKGLKRITYVDFDLHYGDGVTEAFKFSENVQTISLHMFEPGFFPGTGSLNDTKGSKEMINIPLLHGLDDSYLENLMLDVLLPLTSKFDADCVVIQCGSDGLCGDKYNEWQLSITGLTDAIISVMKQFEGKNIILLGGGGYNEILVSRFYTYLTSKVLCIFGGIETGLTCNHEELLPDHEFIELYKSDGYKFWSYAIEGERKVTLRNDNNISYIQELKEFYHL